MKTFKNTNSLFPSAGERVGVRVGFTLVELIVVIAILAILATIAFLSFGSFSSKARDGSRVADINSISKSLELFQVNSGNYPYPDSYFTVTYSGGSLWYQGTVGDTVITTLSSLPSKISKKPIDPLTQKEYIYSILAYGRSYQLKADYEGNTIAYKLPHLTSTSGHTLLLRNSPYPKIGEELDRAYASSGNPQISYIKGNYNGLVVKTLTGSTIYVLAVPSIVTSQTGTLVDVLSLSGKLLINGQTNSGGISFSPILVFSGAELPADDTASGITNLTNAIKQAYTTYPFPSDPNISNVLSTTGATNITSLGANIITNYLGGSASAPPPPPSTGYSLSNSLLFDSASSQYLSRTPSVVGNRQIFTFSYWVKRGKLGTSQYPFGGYISSNTYDFISFESANNHLRFYSTNAGSVIYDIETTQVFQDPSSWYHIVVAYNSTQAIDSNRVKIYVNGSQVTALTTTSYPALNANTTVFNTINSQLIGQWGGSSGYFDGYLADVSFVDSGALDPTAFGYTDPTTNQWLPKAYTGTYGTNGFHLDFLSGATVASLGTDSSGNNNTWTVNGISAVANNQVIDTPLNNFATLNPLSNKLTVPIPTLSKGNLVASATTGYHNISSSIFGGFDWYAEVTIKSNPVDQLLIGISAEDGAYSNGVDYYNATTSTAGTVIGIANSFSTNSYTIYKNNLSVKTGSLGGNLNTGVWIQLGNGSNSVELNAGQRPFANPIPSGFKALSTGNLPDPTIKNPKQYFDVLTYTGNALNQTIGTLSFQPDFVWIKRRDIGPSNHGLIDIVRGANKQLSSSLINTELTTTDGFIGFLSNGFVLNGPGASSYDVNYTGGSYVAWNWKAGGTGAANNNGTIASQVSANPTAGFSIVTYTGTQANATVGHGLGVAPKMIIVKNRDDGTRPWAIYHAGVHTTLPANYRLSFDTGAIVDDNTVWNYTQPTTTLFSLGVATWTNKLNLRHIAYCFTDVPGYSKFGSYTGNGSSDGPFVYTGFRPRYVMWKRTDTIGGAWFIYDTVRSTTNIMGEEVYANDPGIAGVTTRMDFVSNGFKLRAANPGDNTSGATYIYAAFAEAPFKYANAR